MPKIIEDETVYRATVATVLDRGYAGATTRQIAEAAGVSEVTLFRKYGTKADLVREALAATARQTKLGEAAYYTGDVAADLIRVAEAYQASARQHGQFFYSFLAEVPRHPELAELLESPLDMFSNIGQLLARYQSEGILRREHPFHAIAALLGPLMVITMLRRTTDRFEAPPINSDDHVRAFLRGRQLD